MVCPETEDTFTPIQQVYVDPLESSVFNQAQKSSIVKNSRPKWLNYVSDADIAQFLFVGGGFSCCWMIIS